MVSRKSMDPSLIGGMLRLPKALPATGTLLSTIYINK